MAPADPVGAVDEGPGEADSPDAWDQQWWDRSVRFLRQEGVSRDALEQVFNPFHRHYGLAGSEVAQRLRSFRDSAKADLRKVRVGNNQEFTFQPVSVSMRQILVQAVATQESPEGLDPGELCALSSQAPSDAVGDINSGTWFRQCEATLNAGKPVPSTVAEAIAQRWVFPLPFFLHCDAALVGTRSKALAFFVTCGALPLEFRNLNKYLRAVACTPVAMVCGDGDGDMDPTSAEFVIPLAASDSDDDEEDEEEEEEEKKEAPRVEESAPSRRSSRQASSTWLSAGAAEAAAAAEAAMATARRRRRANARDVAQGVAQRQLERDCLVAVLREARQEDINLVLSNGETMTFRPMFACVVGDNEQQHRFSDAIGGHCPMCLAVKPVGKANESSHKPSAVTVSSGQSRLQLVIKQRKELKQNEYINKTHAPRTLDASTGNHKHESRIALAEETVFHGHGPAGGEGAFMIHPTPEMTHTLLMGYGRILWRAYLSYVPKGRSRIEIEPQLQASSRYNASHVYQGQHWRRVAVAAASRATPDADALVCFMQMLSVTVTASQFLTRSCKFPEAVRMAGALRVAARRVVLLVRILLQQQIPHRRSDNNPDSLDTLDRSITKARQALLDVFLGHFSALNKSISRPKIENLHHIQATLRYFGSLCNVDSRNTERAMQALKSAASMTQQRSASFAEHTTVYMVENTANAVSETEFAEPQSENVTLSFPRGGAVPEWRDGDRGVVELGVRALHNFFSFRQQQLPGRGGAPVPTVTSTPRPSVTIHYADRSVTFDGVLHDGPGDYVRVINFNGHVHHGRLLYFAEVNLRDDDDLLQGMLLDAVAPNTPVVLAVVLSLAPVPEWTASKKHDLLYACLGDWRKTYDVGSDSFVARPALYRERLPPTRSVAEVLQAIEEAGSDTGQLLVVGLSNLQRVLVAPDYALKEMLAHVRQSDNWEEDERMEDDVLTVSPDSIQIPEKAVAL